MDKIKKIINIIPPAMRLPIIWALVFNSLTYFGSRIFTQSRYHYDLTNPVDEMIPVIPEMMIFYWGSYLYWAVNYVIASRREEETAYRFFSADFFAKIICLIVFLLFPTTNVRPELTQQGFFYDMLRTLYEVDAADNLLPSIHCLTSWFCYIAVRDNEKIPKWYRYSSLFVTIMICVSTVTTKQHVLIDVAAGIALAEGSYQLVYKTQFCSWYRGCMQWLRKK